MKKYLLYIPAAVTLMLASCSAEEGTMPGTDSNPSVRVYVYASDADGANTDSDIKVRFANNSATEAVYYLVEKSTEFNKFFESASEAEYIERVISTGTKIDVKGAADTDVYFTGLINDYNVSAVAVGSGNKVMATDVFHGTGWESLGLVQYTDGFVACVYGLEAPTYYVPIEENTTNPGYYRLVNAYGEYYPYNDDGDYDPDVTSYLYVNATDPDHVSVPRSYSTTDWGNGTMFFWDMAGYSGTAGEGTLADGKITFPVKALLLGMGTSLYYANSVEGAIPGRGAFCIDLNTLASSAGAPKKVNAEAKSFRLTHSLSPNAILRK